MRCAAALLILGLAVSSCSIRNQKPGRSTVTIGRTATPSGGSKATADTRGNVTMEAVQSENAATPTSQEYQRSVQAELTIPAGSRIVEINETRTQDGSTNRVERRTELSAPAVEKRTETEKTGTSIGAAQKDTAREIGAKMAAMRPIAWVGIVLFLFGIAGFTPWVRPIVASVTTSVLCIVGGIVMMVLPALIVGHEILILVGGLTVPVFWFIAHRHGQGAQALQDKDQDGIDDRLEALVAKVQTATTHEQLKDLAKEASKLPGGPTLIDQAIKARLSALGAQQPKA